MVITLYQHDIVWADAEANRRRVEQVMSETPGCDLFVVPETFTTGFGEHMASLAEEPDGPTLQWARSMASSHNLLFVGTWIVRDNGQCFNRLHWVYPDSSYGHYDKAHTFRVSGEADQISRGTSKIVFEWQGWRIRPAVCYDLRFPKWLRNDNMDYDLLLVCANWPASRREAWRTLIRARAIENLCYVAGCNRIGIDDNESEYCGDSAVIDYKGNAMQEGGESITVSMDKERLESFRQRWPFYLDFD